MMILFYFFIFFMYFYILGLLTFLRCKSTRAQVSGVVFVLIYLINQSPDFLIFFRNNKLSTLCGQLLNY